jgi:hypothetical protein
MGFGLASTLVQYSIASESPAVKLIHRPRHARLDRTSSRIAQDRRRSAVRLGVDAACPARCNALPATSGGSSVMPYDTGGLQVGDGHQLYWEVVGNEAGVPAVFLHGGPGSGSRPAARQYFDPSSFQAYLFDQRGCDRGLPMVTDAGSDLSTIALRGPSVSTCIRDDGHPFLEPGLLSCRRAIACPHAQARRHSAVLVHGRRDISSPLDTAWRIHRAWPRRRTRPGQLRPTLTAAITRLGSAQLWDVAFDDDPS